MPTASLCCGGTSEERNGFHTYSYSTCSQVKQEKHRRYESVDISRAKNLEPVGYGRANVCVYIDSVLKRREITLPTKVRIVKAMIFPVVTDGCELDHKEG